MSSTTNPTDTAKTNAIEAMREAVDALCKDERPDDALKRAGDALRAYATLGVPADAELGDAVAEIFQAFCSAKESA